MLFVMFTYQHKWVCILTSRPLRPTAAQTKWSSFSTLVKILEEQCIGYMFSQDPTPPYTSKTMRASYAGDIYIQAK